MKPYGQPVTADHPAETGAAGARPRAAMVLPRHISPNLALDQMVSARLADRRPVVHLGLGEARLPVHPALADRLASAASANRYGPVAGGPAVRRAAAGYFARRRLATDPGQIVVAPGSKPLLFALLAALPGDVVVPRPCWVSYAPQAMLAGRAVLAVPGPPGYGGVPDPDALRTAVRRARRAGGDPRIMICTLPDNPTGTLAPPDTVRALCEVADGLGLTIVSDEIYRDIVHDPRTPYLSPAEVVPDRTIVTTGLSKHLALAGWRVGLARFPGHDGGLLLRDQVLAVASELWTSLAAPMQDVAAYALDEPPEIVAHLAACSRLHGEVAGAVHRLVTAAGADCPPPLGAFYLYPDFEPLRPVLAEHGLDDAASLQHHLLEEHGVAVLGGHHFGDDPAALRLRLATSQLYGESTSLQWAAINAADPVRLPHMAAQLEAVGNALTALGAGAPASLIETR